MIYFAAALTNLGIIGLTAFALYTTGSLWSILILCFFVTVKKGSKKDG
jgi:hypothetical protein